MLTANVISEIERSFPADERALVESVLADLAAELYGDESVSHGDRVERAVLVLARGDLDLLDQAISLARVDWRNVLANASRSNPLTW